jgi:hypothetical protein
MTTALATRPSATALLGADVRHTTSAAQALQVAGLSGLNVVKVPVVTATHGVLVESRYALETHQRPLPGVTVGEDFEVVQYEENADLLDALARRLGASFANAGALTLSRAFVALELPEAVMVGPDKLMITVAAFMAHGSASNYLVPGACRVMCANQQDQMLREGRDYKITIRHTASAHERTAAAEDTLMATVASMDHLAIEGEIMLDQPVTVTQFRDIADALYPLGGDSKSAQTIYDRRIEVLTSIFTGPTNTNIAGTAWAAYQTIAEYVQWAMSVRGASDTELDHARARRALTSGTAHATQVKAFNVIRDMFDLAL